MSDGNTSAANSAQRTIIIEPDEYGEFDHERAVGQLLDLLGTLKTLGGKAEILADRVKIGELPPEHEGKMPEPLGETVGLVISYRTLPMLNAVSITRQAMDVATGRDREEFEDGPEPEPLEPADVPDDEDNEED